jgi:hypothetical protein
MKLVLEPDSSLIGAPAEAANPFRSEVYVAVVCCLFSTEPRELLLCISSRHEPPSALRLCINDLSQHTLAINHRKFQSSTADLQCLSPYPHSYSHVLSDRGAVFSMPVFVLQAFGRSMSTVWTKRACDDGEDSACGLRLPGPFLAVEEERLFRLEVVRRQSSMARLRLLQRASVEMTAPIARLQLPACYRCAICMNAPQGRNI